MNLAASGEPKNIALTAKVLTPGAKALSVEDAVHGADIVILALPLGKFRNLPATLLDGKLVIDAMNYWWEVDGPRGEIVTDALSSSEAVQDYFSGARVVKALSHIGYHELLDGAKPKGSEGRKAMAIAGNDVDDTEEVAQLVDTLGFEPLILGSLLDGEKLEPGNPAFGADVPLKELQNLLK